MKRYIFASSEMITIYLTSNFVIITGKRREKNAEQKTPHPHPSPPALPILQIHIVYFAIPYADMMQFRADFRFAPSQWEMSLRRLSLAGGKPRISPAICWNRQIFHVTGHLCGEFTGHQFPRTKASDAELWCFLWSAPEYTVEQTIVRLVIWDAIAPIMTSS